MKEKTLEYYKEGYNCSQCILKAFEYVYKRPLPEQVFSLCQGVNTGFGVGGMCSVLIAGIMILGLLFDEEDVKRLRIKLLFRFQEKHGDMGCMALVSERKPNMKCEEVVGEIAGLLDEIIREEGVILTDYSRFT